ncbi:anaerobic dimethyl sulfoxide reductase subunit C [Klebsiella quasipneumoniae]|nr:anaerobic dimethyl sulfoxide reductase subunit C [Klebsiella quasipneumoniae]
MTTQYGFFIDSARCTGCKTCELACKDYKNLTPEVSFRRIYEYAGGDWQEDNGVWNQNVFAYYLSIACNHCEDPACTKVCPSGAMHKREDGFVVVNEEVCIGCRYCHMACPYGAPQYNADKGHMTKCDGCHERVAEGKKPICVESCPLRALDFGPIAELRAKHGQLAAVAPLPSAHFTRPSIVIKPNANARRVAIPLVTWRTRRRCEMGNGWHEWPLMIFTVFGQCVAGGFIVLALALMTGKLSREQEQRVVGSMFGLWVLMGVGFIASTMHLGSPLRAFNSLNRVGASSLSNEIASGAIFFAIGGIGWLLAVCKKLPAGLRSLWLVVTMALGVIFVWMMVRVYNTIDTVPTWYTVWTPLSFFLTLFIGGPLLGYLLLRVAGVDGWAMRLLPVVTLLALLASIVVVLMQGIELATIRSSIQQASALVPDYGLLMAWRVVLLALALACWCVPQIRGRKPALSLLGLAFVLVLAGEMIGRGVFYGLHMTVGMAIAS